MFTAALVTRRLSLPIFEIKDHQIEAIIFICIQASGKSTFYFEKMSKSHLRLNLDMLKTRYRESILLNACIKAKQPVVIDNTNATRDDRERYIGKLKQNQFKVIGYYFKSSIEECLHRDKMRKGKEKIPEIGIKSTYNILELPGYSEGFDELYYISIGEDGFTVEGWKNEV
ncbi:MAG: AAA family ATPase [Planctomycetota bacterium]